MEIFGAGLAGLLAASMLRRHKPVVYELQESLPNNHSALLRFRSLAVSQATGIPFSKVRVTKSIYYRGEHVTTPNIKLSNLYSRKVTGHIIDRSINDLSPVDRYIAPDNFIQQLAQGIDIKYGVNFFSLLHDQPIISTLPLTETARLVDEVFMAEWRPIWSLTGELPENVNVNQTVYFPDQDTWAYRASISGRHFIIESAKEPQSPAGIFGEKYIHEIMLLAFGIESYATPFVIRKQAIGKIMPGDEMHRKAIIARLTEEHGVYSVGRFATWRQILLDDVVQDVHVVDRLINGHKYERKLHASKPD